MARKIAAMGQLSEKDRHDREGGRQLLIFTIPLAILFAFLGWSGSLTAWLVAAAVTAVSVAIAVFPIVAIRLVSGRAAELLPAPEPSPTRTGGSAEPQVGLHDVGESDPARAVLEARSEGTPAAVALIEHVLPKARRRGLGIALMVLGAAGFVAGIALAPSSVVWKVGGTSAFLGLVLWYRTL